MEELARIALVGTAKHDLAGRFDAEHPAESLLAPIATEDREEAFLLRAGVRAVYEQCGQVADSGVEAIEPCPADSRPFASGRFIGLLENALAAESWDILLEFLRELEVTGLLVPPELLPAVLGIRDAKVRERLLPVLGERGRWLSRFDSTWGWANAGCIFSSGDRKELTRQWEEGNLSERCQALKALRAIDLGEARQLLEAMIDREKADHRVQLLESLAAGLSAEDEPFLEARLDDRSELVRRTAAALLAQLPQSALIKRMKLRTESIFSSHTTGILKKKLVLQCQPPEEIDKTWQRDGIADKAPSGKGKRAYWAEMLLSSLPPSLWCERFRATPTQLIEAIADDSFAKSILEGWTKAAVSFAKASDADAAWLRPLWDYWIDVARNSRDALSAGITEQMQVLLGKMPLKEAEESLLPLLKESATSDRMEALGFLPQLSRPWSATFSAGYLHSVRYVIERTSDNRAYQWSGTLNIAAKALPRESFANALETFKTEDAESKPYFQREIERFIEIIHMRRQFYQELSGANASS